MCVLIVFVWNICTRETSRRRVLHTWHVDVRLTRWIFRWTTHRPRNTWSSYYGIMRRANYRYNIMYRYIYVVHLDFVPTYCVRQCVIFIHNTYKVNATRYWTQRQSYSEEGNFSTELCFYNILSVWQSTSAIAYILYR